MGRGTGLLSHVPLKVNVRNPTDLYSTLEKGPMTPIFLSGLLMIFLQTKR
ncbi:hypothetical protein JOD43_004483 [Pullulanibacillus pueri]|nr:hypothetical protein [Pullulanibacillus pueri]